MRFSSRNLHWASIDLEGHVVPPREVPEGMTHYLHLPQWQGNSAARGDRLNTCGRFVPYARRPTTLGLLSPGTLPPVRATSKHDVLLCAIDKDFFNKVSDEMEHERIASSAVPGGPIASDEPNFYDAALSRIMQLLRDEAKSGGPSGTFYVEHLAHALGAGNFEQADGPDIGLVLGMSADTKDQETTPKTRTMARIGCFSHSGVGHVSPLLALARRLQGRGHELVFFQRPDLESRIRAAGVPFAAYGEDELPLGSLEHELRDLSQLEGPAAFERAIAAGVSECRIVLREGPELLRKHRIELLLVDECCDAGSTLARMLRIPFVSLALALTRIEEPGVPYWGCPLPYSEDPAIVAQYVPWSNAVRAASAPLLEPINQERARFGLPPVKHVMEAHSELATISQQPAKFDFPRRELPASFHYTSPFLDLKARPEVPFP
jgi:hypothetical protein